MLSFKNLNSLKTGSKAVVVVCAAVVVACTAVGSAGVVAVTSTSIAVAVDVCETVVSEPKS